MGSGASAPATSGAVGEKRASRAEGRFSFVPWQPGVRRIESSRGPNKNQEQGYLTCTVVHPRFVS